MRSILLLVLLWAGEAQAGAWMREAGTGFFALSGTVSERLDQSFSAYLEYGLRPTLTLGADLDLSMPYGSAISGSGRIFLQKPLREGTWNAAYRVGLGAAEVRGSLEPFASLGLSFGRGLSWHKGGWAAFDARLDLGSAEVSRLKLDSTLGLTLGARSKAMLQLFVEADSTGSTMATLSPAFVYTPKRGGAAWLIAVEAKSKEAALGVKLGLWRHF
ncbi:MAG: hypothetical protein AAGF60_14485 [Pseudomonadota bacterium]